ncbi:MAG: AraC family transcriptional regulator [Desulfobacterales bacterium]|nr:AraC family transcriptional regulator [Desulfobacterales bacterium]
MEIINPTYSQSHDFPSQLVYNLPKRLGSGIIQLENFSSGLRLMYINMKPSQPVTLTAETIDWNFGVSFNISGNSRVRSLKSRQLSAKAGLSAHYAYPSALRIEEEIGITHKSKIAILFDPKTLLDLANEDEEPFLPFLKGFHRQIPVTGQAKTGTEMKRALSQLISCPYRGKTRALYLEGKVMEIFAGRLEQIREMNRTSPRRFRINSMDTERIHYAAELLIRDPLNPPDLTELAGKIGMSRSKFFQNFKMVFGHSPMGHLRSHRLRTAMKLLQQGRHNVTEVAYAVGFNNLSYFTRAFIDAFGVPPRKII